MNLSPLIIRHPCTLSLAFLVFAFTRDARAQARPAPRAPVAAPSVPVTAQPTVAQPSSQPTLSTGPITTAPAVATPITMYSAQLDGVALGPVISVTTEGDKSVALVFPDDHTGMLYRVHQRVLDGQNPHTTLVVTVRDPSGSAHQYTYGNAWESRYAGAAPVANGNGTTQVHSTFVYETMQVAIVP